MKKILVATEKPFAKEAIAAIRKVVEDAGYTLALLEKYTSKTELCNSIADADALIIRSDIVDKEVVEAAKNLKIVVRAGAGYDNIDLEACTKHGIVAMNTPGQNSNAVAELAFGMMLYMARGGFDGGTGTELRGKTLGIHGYGNVGRYIGKIALGFGMKTYAFRRTPMDEIIKAEGIIPLSKAEDIYKNCQYVTLHIPANEQTKKSINYDLLSLMPKGATLVNTARKEIIDEESLLKMFAERPDFKYLSDIERACKAEISEKYSKRYFFTPKKMGAQTLEANNNAGIAAAQQIIDFFEKGDVRFKVN